MNTLGRVRVRASGWVRELRWGAERAVRAQDLARVAAMPAEIQVEVARRWPGELSENPHLCAEGWLAVATGTRVRQWVPAGSNRADASVGHELAARALAEVAGTASPAAVEWIVTQVADARSPEAERRLWPLVLDEARRWALEDPLSATGRGSGPFGASGTLSRLVRMAPAGVRRELGALGELSDRVVSLALDWREGLRGGARDARWVFGAGVTKSVLTDHGTLSDLAVLAALCRARPALGRALGAALADEMGGAVGDRELSRLAGALAWTVPWTCDGGRTGELLDAVYTLARRGGDLPWSHLRSVTLLGEMPAVPDQVRVGVRWLEHIHQVPRWADVCDFRQHRRVLSDDGGSYARALLAGRRRVRGPVTERLESRQMGSWVPRESGWADVVAVERACGADRESWRLALALADGELTGAELADVVAVATW